MNWQDTNNFAAGICGIKPAATPARIVAAHKLDNKPMDKSYLSGLFQYEYTCEDLTLQCYLDYCAGERESRDCPGYPATVTLIHALANGIDVACLLDDGRVDEIEEEAMLSLDERRREDDYGKGEERYHDRMEAA